MKKICPKHKETHSSEAISQRLNSENKHNYLKDAVYGAIDGGVTTFAVVTSVAGAGLATNVILILGFANLIADGFSMAVGNFVGTKAEIERNDKIKALEKKHIEIYPEGEKEEIRQIFKQKGFSGETLELIVETITKDEDLWVDTMLQDEYGLGGTMPSPLKAGMVTYLSFILVGLIPLLPFLINNLNSNIFTDPFLLSIIFTAISFFIIGAFKSIFIIKSWFRAGIEVLAIGSLAALMAYGVGNLLSGI